VVSFAPVILVNEQIGKKLYLFSVSFIDPFLIIGKGKFPSESINQSTNQPTNQSFNQSITQ